MFVRNGQRAGSILQGQDEPAPEPTPEPTPEPAPEQQQAETPDVSKQPAQADQKAAWVDYAVTRGLSRDDAEAMTKAELIELTREEL